MNIFYLIFICIVVIYLLNIISFLYTKISTHKSKILHTCLLVVNILYTFISILLLYGGILPLKDICHSFIHDKTIIFSIGFVCLLLNFMFINTYRNLFFMRFIVVVSVILFVITSIYFIKYLPYKEYETILFELEPNFVAPAPLHNFIANYIVSICLISIVSIHSKNIVSKDS